MAHRRETNSERPWRIRRPRSDDRQRSRSRLQVLDAIRTMSAVSAAGGDGLSLLAAYAAGMGISHLPFAIFLNWLLARPTPLRYFGSPLQMAAGVVMVIVSIAMITAQLTVYSYGSEALSRPGSSGMNAREPTDTANSTVDGV